MRTHGDKEVRRNQRLLASLAEEKPKEETPGRPGTHQVENELNGKTASAGENPEQFH